MVIDKNNILRPEILHFMGVSSWGVIHPSIILKILIIFRSLHRFRDNYAVNNNYESGKINEDGWGLRPV
jgi:hypothetical protein